MEVVGTQLVVEHIAVGVEHIAAEVEHIAAGVEDKFAELGAHKVAGVGEHIAVEVVAAHRVVVEVMCKLGVGHNLIGRWWVGLVAAQAADNLVNIKYIQIKINDTFKLL